MLGTHALATEDPAELVLPLLAVEADLLSDIRWELQACAYC